MQVNPSQSPYGAPPPMPNTAPPPMPYGAPPPMPYGAPPPPYATTPTQLPYGAPPPLPAAPSPWSPPSPYAAPPAFAMPPSSRPQPEPAYVSHADAQLPPYLTQGSSASTSSSSSASPPPSTPEPRSLRKPDATPGASQRVRFIRLTYLHLLGAILAFAGLLYLFMTNGTLVAKVSVPLIKFALGGRWNWAVVLAAFMAVSWVADYWASHAGSRAVQYAGLAFYVLAEALIFVPLLAIVEWKTQALLARGGAEPHIVRDAAFVTIGIFTALTASVFLSRKDFSFLRSGLVMASGAALSLIAMSLVFGFGLGLVFSVAMVLLAAGYVLYQTSQVLAHYDPRQHVAAALALFSSVALMFWYVIRIFMRARD